MSKVLVTESYLSQIANAIRSKLGGSTQYRPGDMANAIESIPTGGITPTGTKNITQNGTHDVTQYASANVNVPNSYAAGDEGKVVSNGALVAQTSRNIAVNGTYDTTTNDEVVVSVQPNLQSKTATENGTVTPDQGYDGLSSVVVNVSGGGLSGIHFGTDKEPSSSLGSDGEYYYQRVNYVPAINSVSGSKSGSNTKGYGIEFYATEDVTITSLCGLCTENRTGKLQIGTTSSILAEIENVTFTANEWAEVDLATPLSLTANTHYVVKVIVDDSYSSGKIGYVQSVSDISYNSIIKYVISRYTTSYPGTTESNSGIMVGFNFIADGIYRITRQYYKSNGAWSLIT